MLATCITRTSLLACFALAWSYSPAYGQTISPRQLVEISDFNAPVISPDGRFVTFRLEVPSVERNRYDTAWYVQAMDGTSPPLRVADGGVPLRNSAGSVMSAPAVWSPDSRWIYYRAMIDDRIDVWRAAVNGSRAEPLSLDSADVRDFVLSADGKVLKYSIGASREEVVAAEEAEYLSGILVDERTPVAMGLFRSASFGGRLATQRYTGDILWDWTFVLSDRTDKWKQIELASLEITDLSVSQYPPRTLTPADLVNLVPAPSVISVDSRSGRIALLTEAEGDDRFSRGRMSLSMLTDARSREPERCFADACVNQLIGAVHWRPNSDDVVFSVSNPSKGFAQSIYRWNVRTGEVQEVVHGEGVLGGGRFRHMPCGMSAQSLACVAEEAGRAPRLERIDIDSGYRTVLFEPNKSLDAQMAILTPRLLRWSDEEGQEFTGYLFPAITSDGAPPPLFVNFYRCPGFMRGGIGDQWPFASLASHGISALCIDASSHQWDAVTRYDEGISAVQSVVKLLASTGQVDPSRVGMGGLSFGNEVALWVAANTDLLRALSVSAPAVTPLYYLMSSLKGDDFLANMRRNWQLGAPDETPEHWQRLSPAFHIDKFDVPILFQMPEQEYPYTLDYTIPLIRARRAEMHVFPHEPHVIFHPRHKLAANERNLDWFRFWLQGAVDEDPRKSKQYERWRQLDGGKE
ncbi:Atxe2 family lasso peptide isopeptidase [Luteimonas sp. BDR2-5]|uniref:Atxe2 family lasso peptide isopeptidase n=1 Tax=Proluteimonas luteida TaxID=2878685 RepID=UPI001E3AE11A|nr:Atxe2 family lasso peptide isopeptidase [Luteimonas sp. BDR2-5]MCD9026768.1 Atxe2 family lasso peptide isopeptidase [Luteimonas sp. BDR2-5]